MLLAKYFPVIQLVKIKFLSAYFVHIQDNVFIQWKDNITWDQGPWAHSTLSILELGRN